MGDSISLNGSLLDPLEYLIPGGVVKQSFMTSMQLLQVVSEDDKKFYGH